MTARDWETMMPFGELRREMDRLLDNFVGGIGKGIPFRGHGYPLVNVWESDEYFCVEAEVPGLTMNDIEVQVLGGELTIRGRCPEAQAVDVTYHRQERHTGEFSRVVRLSERVKFTLTGLALVVLTNLRQERRNRPQSSKLLIFLLDIMRSALSERRGEFSVIALRYLCKEE